VTQILQLGIGDALHFCTYDVNNRTLPALIIIFEHCFFLSQEGKEEPEHILEVATAKYKTSQTQAAVKEAVKEVLHQDDGDDEKLCNMVEAIILCNLMCECHWPWWLNLYSLVPFSKGLTGRRKNIRKSCSIDVKEPIVQVDGTWSLHFIHLMAANIINDHVLDKGATEINYNASNALTIISKGVGLF